VLTQARFTIPETARHQREVWHFGEADWKLIAIAITDPWAPYLNDVNDLEEKLPGLVDAIREWFRTYKIPDGKPENKFGLEGMSIFLFRF
jgi:inorganic pyrophosphatase